MDRIHFRQWASYWRLAWKFRPPSKLFTPYRVIPTVVSAALLFMLKRSRGGQTPITEIWVGASVTVGVYIALYVLEVLFRFLSISPVLMDISGIGILTRQDERKRVWVQESLKVFSASEQTILKIILDLGMVTHESLFATDSRDSVFGALEKGRIHLLVMDNEKMIPGPVGELLAPRGVQTFYINPSIEHILRVIFDHHGPRLK
jgi:hypothetical protein